MKRLVFFVLIIIALGGVIAYFTVPWNRVIEARITAFLHSRGLDNITFKIDRVGLYEATFENIQVGRENPLLLQSVNVQYRPKEVLDGNIEEILLTGLDVQILQTDEGWKIAGLDDVRPKAADKKSTLALSDLVDILPFSRVAVKNSNLRVVGKSIQTSLPFNLLLTKTPDTLLEMTVNASNVSTASSEASLGIVNIKAKPDEARNWKAAWSLKSLDLGESLPVPVLKGEGTLSNVGDEVIIDGAFASTDKKYNAAFTTSLDLKDSRKNALTVKSAAFPFKQGVISARDVRIPFDRAKNITVNVDVRKVSLNELMSTLTGERVSATGTVSGRMPVILRPNGSYTLGKGTLKADTKGLIQMPGEIIPGDNAQTKLVREILENLHYSVFSAAVDTSAKDGLVVRLALEGNNPDVYNGRIVKLNVNLTGDVLDFIQQNAMLFSNPEKLLERGTQ